MSLSKEQLAEFQTLYKRYLNIDLSEEEADQLAMKLIGIISITSTSWQPQKLTNENAYEQRTSTVSLSTL